MASLHVAFQEAVADNLAEAGLTEVLSIADDLSSDSGRRLANARLRALAAFADVTIWCSRSEAGRLCLGCAAQEVLACPPPGATVFVVWFDHAPQPAEIRVLSEQRTELAPAALAEYAFEFEAWVAVRKGRGRGALAAQVPDTITTDRLLLRSPRPGDGRAMFQAVRESRERFAPWFPWVDEHASVADSEHQSRGSHLRFLAREDLTYRGFLRPDGPLVLSTGFHNMDWPRSGGAGPRLEIGYWVRTGHEGCGYVSEAVEALTGVAFDALGCRRLEIRCAEPNERSRRIPERLGFELEARLRAESRLPGGEVADTLIYVKLAGS